MIHASLKSDGTLTLQADSELEAFALNEWQRRRKLGKATLVIDSSMLSTSSPTKHDVLSTSSTSKKAGGMEKQNALLEAVQEPKELKDISHEMDLSVSTTYQYLQVLRRAGLVKEDEDKRWVKV